MRTSVLEMMNIIESIEKITRQMKILSIDPQLDRSTESDEILNFSPNLAESVDPQTDIPNQNTKGCRGCPEGMEW